MDYFGTIKKAYEITIKHKFLWIFGILAGGYGGFKSFNFSLPNYTYNSSSTGSDGWTKILGHPLTSTDIAVFWANWGGLIIGLIIALFLIAMVMFILNIISQGALVGSVEKISKDQKSDFKDGFRLGAKQFWRVWGVAIIYLLMILGSLCVLIIPTCVLVMTGGYVFAVIWGILFFFVSLAFWILIGVISPYSLRVVVLEKFSVWQSIRESLHFFRDNWVNVVLMYLLLLAFSIGFGLVLGLAIIITTAILLAIGYGLYLATTLGAIIYGGLASFALLIAIAVIAGAYNSFYSSALTLTYLELSKKKS